VSRDDPLLDSCARDGGTDNLLDVSDDIDPEAQP
jgi:hypothetical protein